MILAIDIGNTTTSFGVFEQGRLKSQFSIATQPSRTPAKRRAERSAESRLVPSALGARQAKRGNEITHHIKTGLAKRKINMAHADETLVCSVVPIMSQMVIAALRRLGAERLRLVGHDVIVPLINRYTYPEQVGQDRLVGAYAAWKRFRRDCIVADFGTAITIDVVTKRGEYLGGVIAPGLEISLEALATRTALLPKVELREPPELLGRDTANSIRAGLIYGCAALCDGLIHELKARYVPQATVVATGGASPLLAKYALSLRHLRPHLVLEGLNALASLRLKPPMSTISI